jgi:L-malate glycosyltransferase
MTDEIRILIIDNSIGITGAFRSIVAMIDGLTKYSCCLFALPHQTNIQQINFEKLSVVKIPFLEIQKSWRVLFYLPMLLVNSLRVNRIINTHKINILHVNDIYNMVGVLLKVIRPNVRVVYHVRLLPKSYASPLYRIWTRLVFRYADAIVCVSQAVFRELPESPKKMLVYDALPVPLVKTVSAKNDKFTFLYPANFIPGKGQNHALEAFVSVLPKLVDSQLIFIGDDLGKKKNRKYLSKLRQQVKEMKLTDRVIFVDKAQILEPFYRSAHVTLIFSESESFSMTCLESLLYGTPVIATRCGGPEEIIEHEVNGFLVTNMDVTEMGEAMIKLFYDSLLREEMTRQAIKINQKFSIHMSSKKMSDLYMSLLSQ